MENPENSEEEQRKITSKNSKYKSIMGIIVSIIFVVLGFFLLSDEIHQHSNLPPMLIKGIGIFTIVVFGIMGLLHFKRLIRKI